MDRILFLVLAAALLGVGISLSAPAADAGWHASRQIAHYFCVSGFSPIVHAYRGPIFPFDANRDEGDERLRDDLWSPGTHDSAVWEIRDRCATAEWLLSASATASGDAALASQLVVRIRAHEPGRHGLQTVARAGLSRLLEGGVRLRFAAPWGSGRQRTHAVPVVPGKVTKLWFTVAMRTTAGNRYQGMADRVSFQVQAGPRRP